MFPADNSGNDQFSIVEDLLVTDSFLVKGRVEGKAQRLSRVLEGSELPFLSVRDATKVDLRTGETLRSPQLLVNVGQLIFAHEFVDLAGDESWQHLTQGRELVLVRAHSAGLVPFTLTGYVLPEALDIPLETRRFMVMENLEMEKSMISASGPGLAECGELAVLKSLSYIIIRKAGLSCLYGVASI